MSRAAFVRAVLFASPLWWSAIVFWTAVGAISNYQTILSVLPPTIEAALAVPRLSSMPSIPAEVYFAGVFVLCLGLILEGSYRVYSKQEQEWIKELAALKDAAEKATSPFAVSPGGVTPADWNTLADELESMAWGWPDAEWIQYEGSTVRQWALVDRINSNPPNRTHLELLFKRAGSMLLKSPRVAGGLSPEVRNRNDPFGRWLDFIAEREQAKATTNLDSNYGASAVAGVIKEIHVKSKLYCRQCAVEES